MKLLKITIYVLFGFSAAACSEGKYSKMSNSELAEKKRHCDSVPKKSTVFATGCENIRKEIQRRRKKKN